MMMMNTCFWALLSVKDLQFIYTSSYDKLIGQSLFDIIHPDEVSLAKRDLFKFMDSNVNILGGSVTRCRLKDYSNPHKDNNYIKASSWIIVDIIMYVATDNLVLAFFHRQYQGRSICGDHDFGLVNRDDIIRNLRLSTHFHYQQQQQYNNAANSSPHQIFHILDNRTKSVLLSWPDHYPNEIIGVGAQMEFLDDRPMSPISCFHCVQRPVRLVHNKKIHSLVIEYGSISFLLNHVQEIKQLSLPSSPSYYYSRNTMTHGQDEVVEHHFNSRSHHHPYGRTSAPTSPVKKHRISTTSHTKKSAIKLKSLLIPVTHHNKQQQHHQYQIQQRNQCQSCGTDSSPEWRRGPTGHKTLCNACGLRYSRSVARQGKQQQQQQQQQVFHPKKKPQGVSRSPSPSSPTYSRPFNISELVNVNY